MAWFSVFIMTYLYFSIPFNRFVMSITRRKESSDRDAKNVSIYSAFSKNGKVIGVILVALQVVPLLTILIVCTRSNASRTVLFGVLFFAILGNMYPIFNRFHGSKGRTVLTWGLLYLVFEALLVMMVVWIGTYKVTGSPKHGVTINALLLPLLIFFHEKDVPILLICLGVSIVVLLNNRHKTSDFSSK